MNSEDQDKFRSTEKTKEISDKKNGTKKTARQKYFEFLVTTSDSINYFFWFVFLASIYLAYDVFQNIMEDSKKLDIVYILDTLSVPFVFAYILNIFRKDFRFRLDVQKRKMEKINNE